MKDNKNTDCVIVPQAHIDELEEARKFLIKLWEGSSRFPKILFDVTPIMWRITHQKYRKFESKILPAE